MTGNAIRNTVEQQIERIHGISMAVPSTHVLGLHDGALVEHIPEACAARAADWTAADPTSIIWTLNASKEGRGGPEQVRIMET